MHCPDTMSETLQEPVSLSAPGQRQKTRRSLGAVCQKISGCTYRGGKFTLEFSTQLRVLHSIF